jgi:mannose-6-phosphate isomerase-like protein (cupin superfamily)
MPELTNWSFSAERRATIADGMSRIPGANGQRFAEVFEYGSLSVEVYAPRGHDPQQPHTRDEAYIVVQGSGNFVNGDRKMEFNPGDFLFAAAGEVHRFEEFSDDLIVWVIFYGPEGGEKKSS